MLVASMGASAVLLFAVPHSALSQPWNLLGGHLVSALIGVSCAMMIANLLFAAPLAVALAIAAMHYLRCIHPPGGATALSAVVGGSSVHALGYQFVLTPVLLNALIMLITAIVVNYAFSWRRYPASLAKAPAKTKPVKASSPDKLRHGDLEYALREIGSYIDISEEDLIKIYQLANKHAKDLASRYKHLAVGRTYSNDLQDEHWSVRQVIDLPDDWQDEQAVLRFRVVAGHELGDIRTTGLADFASWMKQGVELEQGDWKPIEHTSMTRDGTSTLPTLGEVYTQNERES
jgi:CBS-domain-containing membrane protein